MKNRTLVALALLLLGAVWLALQQISRTQPGTGVISESVIANPDPGVLQKSPLIGELVLVRTPDSEYLIEPPATLATPVGTEGELAEAASTNTAAAADAGPSAAEGDGRTVAMEDDAKEIKDFETSGPDGKEFKETVDPKWLPPIAEGEAAGSAGGGGGGGIGGGGGGGGGGRASEVAAFTDVSEVETSSDTIIDTTTPVVIQRTIIRNVPRTAPVTPVPEPGNAFAGLALAALALSAFLRRQRTGAAA